MKKEKIIREYSKKIKDIEKYDKFYHDKNNPLIDDAKYDKLKNEILSL